MKAPVAFALMFASGLYVLVRLDSGAPAAPTSPTQTQAYAGFPLEREGVPGTSALELDGSFLVTRYASGDGDRRLPLFQIEAVDSGSLAGGTVVFEDVRAILYDGEEGAVSGVIRADEGQVEMREEGLSYPIDLEADIAKDRLVLEGVEVEMREGAPVSPLVLKVDHLEGDLAQELFTSTSTATAVGPGLDARGEGLLLDFPRGVLRFERDAQVVLVDEELGRATLESRGKMHVLRGTQGAEVIARGGALLELEGREEATVRGERINLIATESAGAQETGMRLSRLSADGETEVTVAIGRFRGERADLQVSPRGDMRAELSGSPQATLRFAGQGTGRAVELEISGVGPLLVSVAGESSFEFLGPARAIWEDNVLEAGGGLRGWAEPDGGFSVSCWDDVLLEQPSARLDTGALDLRVAANTGGETLVRVTTGGASRLQGVSSEGDPFVLDADQQVVYRQEGERWIVPLAIGVELDIDSDERLIVRAERVENLEVDRKRLVAEGSVEVTAGDRRVVGDRFEALGPEEFVLYGTPEEPAYVARRGLYVEGQLLEREGPELSSRGSAAAEVGSGVGFAQIHSDSLVGTIRELAGGEREYELWTEGGVRAVFEDPTRRSETRSAAMHVVMREAAPVDGATPATARAVIELDGDVEARWVEGAEVRSLTSRSARIDLERDELGVPAWESTAQGGVALHGEGGTVFHGTGDELAVDRHGEAQLIGLDGRRVQVDGVLPGGRYPFSLDAPSARVSNQRVNADDARLRLESMPLVPGPDSEVTPTAELTVSARSMAAVAGDLFLSGQVSVTGVDEAGAEVSLESGFLQFETGIDTGAAETAFQRMNAWGGFEMHYGDDLHATGDRLEARATTGRLRVTGTPARVSFGDWVQESDLLEYDLFLRIIVRTAAGRFRPRQ